MASRIDAVTGVRPIDTTATSDLPLTLGDRLLAWRDRIQSSEWFQQWAAKFPLTRPIALQRSRALFDITAGFVYTQTLTAIVQLGLPDFFAVRPRTLGEIAAHCALPIEETQRLLKAAMALKLVQPRSAGRFGNGTMGAPLIGNTAITRMVEHNTLLYKDLTDPVALLRNNSNSNRSVLGHFPYTSVANPEHFNRSVVQEYSSLMADTVEPLARDVLDVFPLAGYKSYLDVGGGEGSFLAAVGERYPKMALNLFDLPAVVEGAKARLGAPGLLDRTTLLGGNFHSDPLPTGIEVISLVRVLLDHDDNSVRGLLKKVRASLAPRGIVLIVEPFAGVPGAEVVGDAYFGLYLRAMGRGRARSIAELRTLLSDAGFRDSRVIKTRYPVYAGMIVAHG
jgi:demethylspheroidene O-methyltransferase